MIWRSTRAAGPAARTGRACRSRRASPPCASRPSPSAAAARRARGHAMANQEASMLSAAQDAVRLAQKKGANDAAAGAYRVRNVEVQWRDGKLEKVSEATTRGLGLELYVDGRYAS